MKRFIKDLRHIKDWIVRMHRHLSTTKESEINSMWKDSDPTPYGMFLGWSLEVVQYGAVITIIQVTYFGWQGWKTLPILFVNGMIVWAWLNIVKRTASNIKFR